MLVHLRRLSHAHTGDTVAGAYALNTIGGVLGSLMAGFVLVPLAGAPAAIEILGGLAVAAGAAALFGMLPGRNRVLLSAAAVLSVISLLLTPAHLYERWISACQNRGHRPMKLVDMIQGINTTASVHQFLDTKEKVISSAGMDVAGDSPELRQTQKVQGHVPVILHGDPHDVLTVGFGSGELTKLLTLHRIPRITCVEIAPEMVALSKRNFPHLNLGDSLERKVSMVYMDARNYMHLTDKTYDIIMNDCTWPGYSDASSALYTKEYFQDGKRRLRDGGVYSTWLPINIPELSLRSIVRTFDVVFENTIIVYPHSTLSQHLLLVGQKTAHPYSYTAMKSQFEIPEVKESLRTIGVYRLADVVNMILSQSATMRKLIEGWPVNSDDQPVVEFDVNRSRTALERDVIPKRLWLLITVSDAADLARLLSFSSTDDSATTLTLDTLKRNQLALQYLFAANFSGDPAWKMKQVEEGLKIAPDYADLLALRERLVSRFAKTAPKQCIP
jgi:spermidine synthase